MKKNYHCWLLWESSETWKRGEVWIMFLERIAIIKNKEEGKHALSMLLRGPTAEWLRNGAWGPSFLGLNPLFCHWPLVWSWNSWPTILASVFPSAKWNNDNNTNHEELPGWWVSPCLPSVWGSAVYWARTIQLLASIVSEWTLQGRVE